jgi:hypothetical protein
MGLDKPQRRKRQGFKGGSGKSRDPLKTFSAEVCLSIQWIENLDLDNIEACNIIWYYDQLVAVPETICSPTFLRHSGISLLNLVFDHDSWKCHHYCMLQSGSWMAAFDAFSQSVELLCSPCSNFFFAGTGQIKETREERWWRTDRRGRRQNNFLQGVYHKARSIL